MIKKGTKNDLQNTGQKTKDRATRSPLKVSAPVSSFCFINDTRRVTVKRHENHLTRKSTYWTPECVNKYKEHGNRSVHDNTELNTKRYVIQQHEQHEPHK